MCLQTDRAVQLLLETDAGSTEYYADALKYVAFIFLLFYIVVLFIRACLAATIRSSGASQSTIKLVATNLIAGSHLIGERELTPTLLMALSHTQRVLSCCVSLTREWMHVATCNHMESGHSQYG